MDKCVIDLVTDFFEGNSSMAWQWWKTPNLLLGGWSPKNMVLAGRERKLERFIRNALAENRPSNLIGKSTRSKRRDVGSSPTKGTLK